MIHRPNYNPGPDDDDFADVPVSGQVAQFVGGIVAPLLVAAYAVHCLLSGRATLLGRNLTTTVHGPDAVGLAGLSVAALLHCHYLWGGVPRLAPWAVAGKVVGLVGMIASLGYLLVHLGLLGR